MMTMSSPVIILIGRLSDATGARRRGWAGTSPAPTSFCFKALLSLYVEDWEPLPYIVRVVDCDSIQFDPGVRSKLPFMFLCSYPKVSLDSAPFQQPGKCERLLEAIGSKEAMVGSDPDHPRYAPRFRLPTVAC
jgi:hypothetical protein